jgi:hypothetical protein
VAREGIASSWEVRNGTASPQQGGNRVRKKEYTTKKGDHRFRKWSRGLLLSKREGYVPALIYP